MSKYINLIDLLTKEDKERIENYIDTYGVSKPFFEGLDKWLQNWSHSKQKLFKLLGNQFIKEFDYSYEKSPEDIETDMKNLLKTSTFKARYHEFYHTIILPLYNDDVIDYKTKLGFNHITDSYCLVNDKIEMPIKVKLKNKKTTLQVPMGTKPMRAFSKIIKYFKEDFDFEGFEEFRIAHSMILNDKVVRGKLCFSIHPLDFITMSDNASNWSSCMSWTDGGCYHIGTVEMMNSNNVVCCYLKDMKKPFYFAKPDKETGEINMDPAFTWNNKKWRELAYVTKDIIMSGKAYPYKNNDLNLAVIDNLKDLAKENLKWTYDFGPEEYKDMQYLNSCYSMNRAKNYIHMRNTNKHNIIWDTKGMYNDMLNDHGTTYWCYRNKPKQNKVISVSGKAPCLCCGESVIDFNEYDGYDEYNERYTNCGYVVCPDCMSTFECEECNCKDPTMKRYTIMVDNSEKIICEKCFEKKIRRCPDCGKPIFICKPLFYYGDFNRDLSCSDFYIAVEDGYCGPWTRNYVEHDGAFIGCYMCEDCAQKYIDKMEVFDIDSKWRGVQRSYYRINKDNFDNFDHDKYFWLSLEKVDISEIPDDGVKSSFNIPVKWKEI